ncbi:hypothetical protein RF11_03441 [Thelohanellus kitauei]|uniref:Transmembrane protein n=1 Tax=Thelohanellus kitauei TaxID=669202 RepID=A0A0C2IMG0_THEKT|nr:hypothetical protein RF11_03441 [Thelohanellus kitauei]
MASVYPSIIFISTFIVGLSNCSKSNSGASELLTEYSNLVAIRDDEGASSLFIITPTHIRDHSHVCKLVCRYSQIFPIDLSTGTPKTEDQSKMKVHLGFVDSGDTNVVEILKMCNDVQTAPCIELQAEVRSKAWIWIVVSIVGVLLIGISGLLFFIKKRTRS